MKLVNRSMAGQKLSLSSGVVMVDAEGCVEVEDKAAAEALQRSGFKLVFARRTEPGSEPKAPQSEPKAPQSEPKASQSEPKAPQPKVEAEIKEEPLSTSKVEHSSKKRGK
jgi:hypothetical protein